MGEAEIVLTVVIIVFGIKSIPLIKKLPPKPPKNLKKSSKHRKTLLDKHGVEYIETDIGIKEK